MAESVKTERLKEHTNAFGFLRLFFATLVILAHTPEMADGNNGREILTRYFGSISFGALAVDGFFLISGYLIVGSFANRPNVIAYLARRIARIFPGFIVASLLCLLIVAPLGGARFAQIVSGMPLSLLRMVELQMPMVDGVFAGTNYPQLDSSMWTIRYEFLCYLIVIPLGLAGLLRKPWTIGVIALTFLILSSLIEANYRLGVQHQIYLIYKIPHSLDKIIKFIGIFLAGSLFYIYRGQIKFTLLQSIIALLGFYLLLFVPALAEFGIATFGAYLIFAIASRGGSGPLSRINNRDDISYGVYLYAWPAAKLLMWYWPDNSLVVTGFLTMIIACLCGWISWHLVEKPAIAILIGKRFR